MHRVSEASCGVVFARLSGQTLQLPFPSVVSPHHGEEVDLRRLGLFADGVAHLGARCGKRRDNAGLDMIFLPIVALPQGVDHGGLKRFFLVAPRL